MFRRHVPTVVVSYPATYVNYYHKKTNFMTSSSKGYYSSCIYEKNLTAAILVTFFFWLLLYVVLEWNSLKTALLLKQQYILLGLNGKMNWNMSCEWPCIVFI